MGEVPMVHTNLSYDYVAAFFLFMLLIWYYTEKKVPLRSYRCFSYVIVSAFGATVLEILTYSFAMKGDSIPFALSYFILSVQMLFIHTFFTCITNYLLMLAWVDTKNNKALKYTFIASWILILVICLLNPFLGWAANLTNGVYSIKGVGFVLYGIDAIMVILMGWVLIAKRQNFTFLRKTIVMFLFISAIVAGVAQEFNFAPMLNLVIAMFCMVLYLFGQGPEVDIDKLTKQFSRKFFVNYVKDRFMDKKAFSLIVLDLDDFKYINQSYGVATGDILLQQIGEYLENMSQNHRVFHYGADQFCVVLENGKTTAVDVANEIVERFGKPWVLDKPEVVISATLCIVDCPRDADNPEKLIEIIDYTMENAKSICKGGIAYAADIDFEKNHTFKDVEKAVKDAIASGSIMVHYQPIYSVDKDCYISAEALARLHDEKLGWIAPDVFIGIAEKSGLIIELGEIILHKVCRFIKESDLKKTTIEYIEVNVSSLQLMQSGFADRMMEIMKQYDVEASQINIEITETAMMTSYAVVSDNLIKIEDYNIPISLDDYGSGYANINYLNSMPFKYIKLDRDMIWAAFKKQKARITLEYTIKMLNALNLQIIAEGVETEEMRDELIRFGCHYLQGWFYSKAVPGEVFVAMIEE